MKTNINLVWMFFLLLEVNAQPINLTIPINNLKTISIECDYADLNISTYQGSEIIIESEININEGKQNDHLKIDQQKKGDHLIVESYIEDYDQIPKRKTVYDRNGNILKVSDVQSDSWGKYMDNGKEVVRIEDKIEVTHHIKIPENIQVDIETTYGKVDFAGEIHAETDLLSTYGTVDVVTSSIKAPIIVESGYNCVDLAVPSLVQIDLTMDSQYGAYFTDLKLDFNKQHSSQKVLAQNNGGGPKVLLTSQYNNIYLRSNK